MRKIIQIAVDAEGDLVALCDDGTVWQCVGRNWYDIPDIPQDDPHAPQSPDVGR